MQYGYYVWDKTQVLSIAPDFHERVVSMARYQIGDRVEAIVNNPDESDYIMVGDTGTVCDIDGDHVGVDWDNELGEGHDCSGNCEYGHGWYVHTRYIRPYEDDVEDIDENSFLGVALRAGGG